MGRLLWSAVLVLGACAPREYAGPPPAKPATPAPGSPARALDDVSSLSCGELELQKVGLRAGGEGERHPEVLAVEGALADRCPGGASRASLDRACMRARAKRDELSARGLGSRHPDMLAVAAEIAICPPARRGFVAAQQLPLTDR